MSLIRIFLVSILMAGPLAAQGTSVAFGAIQQDTSLPIEVTSQNLSVDQAAGTAVFTVDVIVSQGEMRLSAPRVLVVYNEAQSAIARMEATGGVTLVSGPDAAESDRADYFVERGTIDMSGNVLLTQGPNALTSDVMSVDLDAGTAQMSGNVKTVLQTGGD
ncbi:MAG: LptA/OstA family protein [Pseudomonadota bacterium]